MGQTQATVLFVRRFLLFLCFVGVLTGPYVWMRDMRTRTVQTTPLPAIFAEEESMDGGEQASVEVMNLRTTLTRMGIFFGFLVAIGGLLIFLRRRGGFFPSLRKTSQIAVVDTLNLGSRHYLAVVEWDGQRFLIGITQQQISLLGEGRDSGIHP